MVTRKRDYGTGTSEWYGKAADIKPTDDYPQGPYNADIFFEIDTGKMYMFDSETKKWLEW